MALVKLNNRGVRSATTFGSITGLGSMVFIKKVTASSSATVSFVDGAKFQFNLSADSGSNYNVTKTTTNFFAANPEDGGATEFLYDGGSDLAQGTGFQKLHGNLTATGNDQGGCGELYIFSPSSTTFVKHFISTISGDLDGSFAQIQYVAGYFNTTSAIDEIQFKVDSGNIDSGTIKLYGIKDS